MQLAINCPGCESEKLSLFYVAEDVPVHSVLLMLTRLEAVTYPRGNIHLAVCQECGFITNIAYEPALNEYSPRYEATQSYSPTFNTFHRQLARHLIERYDLRGKDVIEIGCGQGEFLTLLCEMGDNRGVGFDPAFRPYEMNSSAADRIEFISDFYSEKYADYHGDFVCCKMTLEHIPKTAEFVSMVRRSIGSKTDTIVFFQVPNATRILRDVAFWDIYYEHCSYFTPGALARLFRLCGFEVIDLAAEYDNQYLMIEARPTQRPSSRLLPQEEPVTQVLQDVSHFSTYYPLQISRWRRVLDEIQEKGERAVIWGAGSKGVSFLTTLKVTDEIGYGVDINPKKKGTFMPGTGHEIVLPEFLQTYQPDVVIVMNPVYCDEIQADLERLGVSARLLTV
ncbi:MAG: methyltransferase domain-containing protein [Chloroflexi bacterium]|nr:MAG: methyltransferase domain-containing protein [Chloroflexota bacterium]